VVHVFDVLIGYWFKGVCTVWIVFQGISLFFVIFRSFLLNSSQIMTFQ